MNFADTLYWLQIATTTASNHSSNNSPFPALPKPFLSRTGSHLRYPMPISPIPNFQRFSHYFCITENDPSVFKNEVNCAAVVHHGKASLSLGGCCFDEWSNLLIWSSCTMVSKITGKQIVQLSLIVRGVQYFTLFDLALL